MMQNSACAMPASCQLYQKGLSLSLHMITLSSAVIVSAACASGSAVNCLPAPETPALGPWSLGYNKFGYPAWFWINSETDKGYARGRDSNLRLSLIYCRLNY